MSPDLSRDRKVRVTLHAIWALWLGLVGCLVVAVAKHEVGMILTGLYVPFATGVAGALGLFVNGNVKVHQANAAAGGEK